MKKGLTEKDSRDFWALFSEARRFFLEDCFLRRGCIVCKFCGLEIAPRNKLPNYSQHATTLSSMEGHIKGHIRRGEITWETIRCAPRESR